MQKFIVAAVLLAIVASATEFRLADHYSDYVGAIAGQTRGDRKADGWDYGSWYLNHFTALPWQGNHPCFGAAYGDGACRFTNRTVMRPDPLGHEAAIKYNFQQDFNTVTVNGTVFRPENCGDGNCFKVFLWNGTHHILLASTIIASGSPASSFEFVLNNVKSNWYIVFVTCSLQTTSGDYLRTSISVWADCNEGCFNHYCTPLYQQTCEGGDVCITPTPLPNPCQFAHQNCNSTAARCLELQNLCASSCTDACPFVPICQNVLLNCQNIANSCDTNCTNAPTLPPSP